MSHLPADEPDPRGSDYGSSTARSYDAPISVPTPQEVQKKPSTLLPQEASNTGTQCPPRKESYGDSSIQENSDPAAEPELPHHTAPQFIHFRKNPDHDDFGFKALLEAVTNPQAINWVRGAFRTVAFVGFPLLTIAVHPNTMYRLGFPALLIAAVVSVSTHRPTLGEQIGLHTWTWRGIIYMLIVGTAFASWDIQLHIGAWYGLLAAGIFFAGLVSHGNMRRFMFLYFFIYMMELRMYYYYFQTLPVNNAAWCAADYFIGSLMGVAANLFPYPLLIKNTIDMILTKIFGGFGQMLVAMITYVWSPDPHAAVLFFNDRSPFVRVEAILEVMPALLWFANWEPMEFPIRNPIRRLKLTLLRRIMALTYAAFGSGRTIAALRREQSDRIAMQHIRNSLYQAAHGRDYRRIASRGDRRRASDSATAQAQVDLEDAEKVLRESSRVFVKEFGVALMQAVALMGSTESTPEQLLKKVPLEALRDKDTQMRRNLRLEMLQVMRQQSDLVAQRRSELAKKSEGDASRKSSNSHISLGNADARVLLEHQDIISDAEVFIYVNEIFFHMLMSMVAGELLSFGEQMKDYRPTESLMRRLWNYFVVEPWNDFWEEVWCRLTFQRPCDYRTVKDAIRMTCAFLSATALNLEIWTPEGGVYFFGVTIVLGLPVEEESVGMGVNRMAGNALGCALGYLSYHNGKNLAQILAMALCFCFLLQCFKNHPVYGQTFFYASVITLAGMATSMVTLELLTRLVASCYAIMAYMLCCMFIFPNNGIKICWGYRVKLTRTISEIIDNVAQAIRLPIEFHAEPEGANNGREHEPVEYPLRNTDAMEVCSQLNIQMTVAERFLTMCDKWAPFAVRQPIIRGMAPFPTAASSLVGYAHQRMLAHLRLLVFGVQLLHRPRTEAPSVNIIRILNSRVATFLDDFADSVRVVLQDFVESLHSSRTWSYPLSLSRTSQLSRLRVRLHHIHYECYVLLGNFMSRGTFGMTRIDLEELKRETSVSLAANAEHLRSGVSPRLKSGGRTGGEPLVEVMVDDNAEGDLTNASFADRYLMARQAEVLMGDHPDPAALQALYQSFHASSNGSPKPFSFRAGAKSHVYTHSAPLQESAAVPRDVFPLTQDNVEQTMSQELEHQKRDEHPTSAAGVAVEKDATTQASPILIPDERENNQPAAPPAVQMHHLDEGPFTPAPPSRTLSKLVLVREKGPETYIPLYRGPAFNYREDELTMPIDTDFAALVTIFCNCEGLIAELEGMTGPVNNISGYQKQLHESSLAIGLIDKLSKKVTTMRQKNYERYHYHTPTLEEQKGGPQHAQTDPWQDWRF